MTNFGGAVKTADRYDLAILGIPFDGKSSFLKGPAQGPAAVREASTDQAINAWTESGISLDEDAVVADLGDVDVSGPYPEVMHRIEDRIEGILTGGAVPLVIGGDHSITYPVIRAFARHYPALDILDFDAHPDLYNELYGDPHSHACPFARILEDGLVNRLVQVGIRGAVAEHRERASLNNVRMIEMKDFRDDLRLEFKNPLYISFDMDSLDPAFAPGVSHHEPGGLTTRQALRIIHALKGNIVGMDVVEVNPERDPQGITAAAAVKILMEIAGKVVAQRLSIPEEEQ